MVVPLLSIFPRRMQHGIIARIRWRESGEYLQNYDVAECLTFLAVEQRKESLTSEYMLSLRAAVGLVKDDHNVEYRTWADNVPLIFSLSTNGVDSKELPVGLAQIFQAIHVDGKSKLQALELRQGALFHHVLRKLCPCT